jgi:hypothetical protein
MQYKALVRQCLSLLVLALYLSRTARVGAAELGEGLGPQLGPVLGDRAWSSRGCCWFCCWYVSQV